MLPTLIVTFYEAPMAAVTDTVSPDSNPLLADWKSRFGMPPFEAKLL